MVLHVKNSKEFAHYVKNLDKELKSYDVLALLIAVPVDKALTDIIH